MINLNKKYLLNKTKSATTQFLSAGEHNVNNIPRFCDLGISSTFDAVLRYLPIFFAGLRYLSIFSAVLRCSAPPNVPLSKILFLVIYRPFLSWLHVCCFIDLDCENHFIRFTCFANARV